MLVSLYPYIVKSDDFLNTFLLSHIQVKSFGLLVGVFLLFYFRGDSIVFIFTKYTYISEAHTYLLM